MKIWEIYFLVITCTPIPVYSFQKRYLSGFLNCCIICAALQSAPILIIPPQNVSPKGVGLATCQNVSRTSNFSGADNSNFAPGIGAGGR